MRLCAKHGGDTCLSCVPEPQPDPSGCSQNLLLSSGQHHELQAGSANQGTAIPRRPFQRWHRVKRPQKSAHPGWAMPCDTPRLLSLSPQALSPRWLPTSSDFQGQGV